MTDDIIGDEFMPIYEFEWADGSTRATADINPTNRKQVEALRVLGEKDDECLSIDIVGYET